MMDLERAECVLHDVEEENGEDTHGEITHALLVVITAHAAAVVEGER